MKKKTFFRKKIPSTQSTTVENFLSSVEEFQPYHESIDSIWRFFLEVNGGWQGIVVQKYKNNYFIHIEGRETISYPEKEVSEEIDSLIRNWILPLQDWKKATFQNPIQAQSDLVKRLPLEFRLGVISRRNLQILLPRWMRIDKELKEKEKKNLIKLLLNMDCDPLPEMTLGQYLKYCEIAYQANPKTFEEHLFGKRQKFEYGLSGLEYYQRYADGRHGGLLDIDFESPEAFSKWYHSSEWHGSHPWEIYRGGNSTHISLSVSEHPFKPGWTVNLTAFSSTRLAETCRIALAFAKEGLSFYLDHRESFLKRILAEDWIGVLPEEADLKYGWHLFPEKYAVADCIHLNWIFETNPHQRRLLRNQLKSLVFWLPEEVTAFPRDRSEV